MKRKLTANGVERMPAPQRGRVEVWDMMLPGFGLRLTDKGVKSWFIMTRLHGKQLRLTLGRYPTLSLADAREQARDALRRAALGEDPREEQRRRKTASDAKTFAEVARLFIERHAKPKTRSWPETQRVFEKYVFPEWADRQIETITRYDVIDLVDAIADSGIPIQANRVLGQVRRLFNWAVRRGIVATTPVAGIDPPGKEIERDRVLTEDEIWAVWDACDQARWPFGDLTKLLLLTAQRRSEVAKMRWADLDIDNALWTLPREATKADRLHEVPLSPPAMEILKAAPRLGEYVVTTTGDRPVSGFSRSKRRIDGLSGVEGWRLHDLRRTAATHMAKLNVPEHVLSRILNHSRSKAVGVTAIYNRHGYLDEKRNALNAWAHKLESIVTASRDNVVILRG